MSRTSGFQTEFDRLQTDRNEFHESDDESPPPSRGYTDGAPPAWFPAPCGSPRSKGMSGAGDVGRHHDEDQGDGDVMLHMVPEGSKSRWSHIEDLDSFFKKVYEYYQRHGFKVMMIQKFFGLAQFLFIIVWPIFLLECVDYGILFGDKALPDGGKVRMADVFKIDQCVAGFSFGTWLFLFISFSLWTWKALAVCYQVFQYWDIKSFYNQALKISDGELDGLTWHNVQKRLVEAQSDYLMCIHKEHLTELDVYHRILRFKNYMVAMVNKDLMPVRLKVPCVSEMLFLSEGLKWNIEFLLFKGPWAPFDKWHLKEDYRKASKRKELADHLRKKILLVAFFNLLLMPLIFFWQLLYFFFGYAELIKRDPGSLGIRKWSLYGKLYLRHFNEHDHELKARLNRAYKPANKYLDIFVSPVAAAVARFLRFIAGAVLISFIFLTVWDEDVLGVEHIFTVMTVLGCLVGACNVFVPDPNTVFCPEKTMSCVMAHIHYFPLAWRGKAHTQEVQRQLGELFPYTAVYLLHELVSPVVTPFILMFSLRQKSAEIVDFFRNFTVDIVGVGDVCSFAQMDIRRHGNPDWQRNINAADEDEDEDEEGVASGFSPSKVNPGDRAEDGKTEMSLVHFKLTNPDWKPPQDSENFLTALRNQTAKDAEALPTLTEETVNDNPLCASLNSLDAVGGIYSQLASEFLTEAQTLTSVRLRSVVRTPRSVQVGDSSLGGDVFGQSHVSMMASVHHGLAMGRSSILVASEARQDRGGSLLAGPSMLAPPPNLRQDLKRLGLEEYTAADMSFSALYLHEIHQRAALAGTSRESPRPPVMQTKHRSQKKLPRHENYANEAEREPLVDASSSETHSDINLGNI